MPRSAEATRRRIFETAYQLFYSKGFGRVGMDEIAAAADLTKRTLYFHFRSKDDLLAAVLDFHTELALERIRKWGDRLDSDAEAMVDALFTGLARWSRAPGWTGAGFTRLVMELADLPGHPARVIAKKHKEQVEGWLEAQLSKAGVPAPAERAREIALLLEGANAMILIHGDRGYATAAAQAAKQLLRAGYGMDD